MKYDPSKHYIKLKSVEQGMLLLKIFSCTIEGKSKDDTKLYLESFVSKFPYFIKRNGQYEIYNSNVLSDTIGKYLVEYTPGFRIISHRNIQL